MIAEHERALRPYVPALASNWLREAPGERVRVLDGTLAFVDISGFTALTERLGAQGKAGAEELTGYLDATFAELLRIAYANGGELIKWGGDAVLVWYSGASHAAAAVDAAWRMQSLMGRIGRLRTSAGPATLRMSVGIHTGAFHFFSVGSSHRELLVTGPGATMTAHLEAVAEAGEIVVSPATAALLASGVLGAPKADGVLVASAPGLDDLGRDRRAGPLGKPSRNLPRALRDHLIVTPVESEHRQVAVGFLEFSGVDEGLAGHGEEAVAGGLDEFLTAVQDACVRHAVTFWETDIAEDGGKVMLVAGAPSTTDDNPGRLLATVREVVDAGGMFRLRAGVNAGRVFAGGFGPPYRRTYSAKGDAVNLAARLMARAGPGEIFVSEAALARSRAEFRSEPLEPFLVKGKTQPVHAHRLGAARSAAHTPEREGPPLVGRGPELLLLTERWEGAKRGRGGYVEVSGEPGIGKSRLVEEFRRRAGGPRTASVVCAEYQSVVPYASVRALLLQWLDVAPDADSATTVAALTTAVARRAPSLEPWLPLIATVVGAELPATPEVKNLAERFQRDRLEEVVIDFLSALAPAPSLLVFDDAHWMDDASAGLVRRLIGRIADQPWLVVFGRRAAHQRSPVEESEGSVRIELGPLDADAAARLLRSVVSDTPLAPRKRDELVVRSGGNPLFLLELFEGGRRSGFAAALPDSVEGVFAEQIDRLSPPNRRLLRVASVLGMQVAIPVLAEVLGDETVAMHLADLQEFIALDGEGTLRFRHNMLRDAAYEGLPYTRRRELHARAGEVLERRAGERAPELAPLLAFHYAQAGDHERAWRYGRLAGTRARDAFANVEATTFFTLALEAGQALRAPAPDILEVSEALADAHGHLGEFTRAETAYRRARRWAAEPLDRVRLQFKLALTASREGNYPRTLRLLTRAARELESADGRTARRLRAEITAEYGLVRQRQGKVRSALRILNDAVHQSEQANVDDVLATALLYLDVAELTAGAGDGSHALRALELARPGGDNPWLEARALNQLGIRAYFAGRWRESIEFYSESRAACQRAGDDWTAAIETANLAEVLSDQGHLAEAARMLGEAIETYRAAGTPMFIAGGTRALGRLAARRGDAERSYDLLAAARSIYAADGEPLQVALTDALVAEAFLLAGDVAAAVGVAERVLGETTGHPGRHLVTPLAGRVLAVALTRQGVQPDRAWAALTASVDVARRHNLPYELAMGLDVAAVLRPADTTETDEIERERLCSELGLTDAARRLGSGFSSRPLPEVGISEVVDLDDDGLGPAADLDPRLHAEKL